MQRLRTRVSDLDRRRRHRSTARAMRRVQPEPESWLDVGTGEARFPAAAKEFFPYTSFDGIDPTPRVVQARAAERIEEAYVGSPADPHLAKALTARYDVVSLLNSTEDLGTALTFLRPGGHLLVETTGPADELCGALESLHCTIVPTNRHPLLDRLSSLDRLSLLDRLSRTTRVIARREPSPA